MLVEFKLPGGWLDSKGKRHDSGSLRALNGLDEEWARSLAASTPRAVFITGLLSRCVERLGGRRVTSALVRELTVGDREYLMLKLYQASLGDTVALLLRCPSKRCGSKLDLVLELDAIPVESRAVQRSYSLQLDAARPSEVTFRVPCGVDQEALLGFDAGSARDRLLGACLIGTSLEALSAEARDALVAAIEEQSPRVETEMEARCPECAHVFDAALDWAAILIEELRRSRTSLDRDIHLLASHYHWSLRELLSLTRAARSRYLALIGSSSRQPAS